MKKINFLFPLILVTTLVLGSLLVTARAEDSEPKIFDVNLSDIEKVAGGSAGSWKSNTVSLKKKELLEIHVKNPIKDPDFSNDREILYHSLGYQDRIPDSKDPKEPSIYHESPLLKNALGYEIWYGADSVAGDFWFFLHRSHCFPRYWTPDCIQDNETKSGIDETSDPLVFKIKATDHAGISYIYFSCYDECDYHPNDKIKHTQKFFSYRIKITVE
ncbi:MAG: hypothetical protein ACOYK6_04575 [Chthoniobacterales bacterium]